jgi:hypothetical protein
MPRLSSPVRLPPANDGHGQGYDAGTQAKLAQTRVRLPPQPVMPALSVPSDEIPNLHAERLCHGIVSQSLDPPARGEPTVRFDQCMKAERDDRKQLAISLKQCRSRLRPNRHGLMGRIKAAPLLAARNSIGERQDRY